jgi:wyosine [tRNA(Phe)-imidazoG37] synthetase (radical SAM superfamily)
MYKEELKWQHRVVVSPLFGRALEFEISPAHACPFSCIHCKYGQTRRCTIDREAYFPLGDFEAELPGIFANNPSIDCVVLAGQGEPLLNADIEDVIRLIKKRSSARLAVSSCGTLLWRKDVQQDLLSADIVVVSLDAGDKKMYHTVNNPHPQVPFVRFLQGIEDFANLYKGELWLQVHLLDGVTATEIEVAKIAALVRRIRPVKTFLATAANSLDQRCGLVVENERLQGLARLIGEGAVVLEREMLGSTVNAVPAGKRKYKFSA